MEAKFSLTSIARAARKLLPWGGASQPPVIATTPVPRTFGLYNWGWNRPQYRQNILHARDRYRTSGYARQLVEFFVTMGIGQQGIQVDFGDDFINSAWRAHQWDASRPWHDFAELQRLAMRSMIRDGEFFGQFLLIEDEGRVVLRNLDPLDLPMEQQVHRLDDGGWSAGSIDHDIYDRPTWYRFLQVDKPIPAANIVHIFRKDFGTTARGSSWLYTALDELQASEEYNAAVLDSSKRAVVDQGYYTVTQGLIEALDTSPGAVAAGQVNFEGFKQDVTEKPVLIEGIDYHPAPPRVNLNPAQQEVFHNIAIESITRGFGLSPEVYTGNSRDSTGITFKVNRVDAQMAVDQVQQLLLPMVYQCARLFTDLYFPSYRGSPRFIFPRMLSVDPVKDAQAQRIRIESGVTTRTQEILNEGGDPRVVEAQRRSELRDDLARQAMAQGGGEEQEESDA